MIRNTSKIAKNIVYSYSNHNVRLSERQKCEECVKKHLLSCATLLNEVMQGHPENLEHAMAEYMEACREGCMLELDFNNLGSDIAKIYDFVGIDRSKARAMGYLALASELLNTIDADASNKIRTIRLSLVNKTACKNACRLK